MLNKVIGARGEQLALRYLKTKGHRVVYKNWFCMHGEIDLITFSPEKDLVFVEVKTVSKNSFVSPHDLFNAKKRQHLVRSIDIFLKSKRYYEKYNWRVDLICITYDKIKTLLSYYPNVFKDFSEYRLY